MQDAQYRGCLSIVKSSLREHGVIKKYLPEDLLVDRKLAVICKRFFAQQPPPDALHA